MHLADLTEPCKAEKFPSAERKARIVARDNKYKASYARVAAANPNNARREHEDCCKRILENPEEATTGHVSLDERVRAKQELERIEMHRHDQFYKAEIAPETIPDVEELQRIAIAAAERDENTARQMCERAKVPYDPIKDQPYSALCYRTKARQLQAVIDSLKRGDSGQGSPLQILGV